MSPCLDGEIRFGIETNTEDDDGEEASDVTRQFPIFPFASLTRWEWGSVEEVAVGSLLVTWTRPPAGTGVTTSGAEGGGQTVADRLCGGCEGHGLWLVRNYTLEKEEERARGREG